MATLHFIQPFDSIAQLEAKDRGREPNVLVQTADKRWYHVTFYSGYRIREDVEIEAKHGQPFIWDPNIIVVRNLILSDMQEAVNRLEVMCAFEHLRPIEDPGAWKAKILASFEEMHAGTRSAPSSQ
jgi:hypothetical protein